jgi:hypothetical protein
LLAFKVTNNPTDKRPLGAKVGFWAFVSPTVKSVDLRQPPSSSSQMLWGLELIGGEKILLRGGQRSPRKLFFRRSLDHNPDRDVYTRQSFAPNRRHHFVTSSAPEIEDAYAASGCLPFT